MTKYQLCQMLKSVRSEGFSITSEDSTDKIIDAIYDAVEIAPGNFLRELFLREFFTLYLERYPVYASLQRGMKSELLQRLYNNDFESVVLLSDTVFKGKHGLFLAYCTASRQDVISMMEGLSKRLEFVVRQFKTKEHEALYVALTPLHSVLNI